jgi:hypothetical protein
MIERIIHVEVEGRGRLGFDTGLSPQAFAQAKLAQFITQEGHIVFPGGAVKLWQPGGVMERNGSMVIWGPDFKGERLDRLVASGGGGLDPALEALRRWIAAYPHLQGGSLWPAGVFVALTGAAGDTEEAESGLYPAGTVFFPPERLRCRCVQAEGEESWLDGGESLVSVDLGGEAAASFTAGAMLYRVFARAAQGDRSPGEDPAPAALPFPNRDPDLLHQDIREGVFLPLALAAPGLDPGAAALVDRAIAGIKGKLPGSRPSLEELAGLLGGTAVPAGSGSREAGAPAEGPRDIASFFHELGKAEREKLREERDRYEKKRKLTVKTRRFVIRNVAVITGIAAALLIVALFVNSMIASRRDLPTTAGMESREVVETYYGAFGALDHTLMDACVTNRAGKGDIDMVTRYFVTSRVRQAYEYNTAVFMSAQDWFSAGAPPTSAQIFGVTDLGIARLGGTEFSDEIQYRVEYIIWVPGALEAGSADPEGIAAEPGPGAPVEDFIPPRGYAFADELTLTRHKGNWRISAINRQSAK